MDRKSANSMHYVGLDVHKKSVSFCVKLADGTILQEGTIKATRPALTTWAKTVAQPWTGALEATIFSGWIYDYLRLEAHELKVAHPAMLKAIFAGKKSNDKIDARKISDLLRCNLLPESYMAPSWIRELRRILRYRRMLLAQSVRFKNRISGLLMETGTEHEKSKLHGKKYFSELVQNLQEVPDSVSKLLRLSRSIWENFHRTERQLIAALQKDARLRERIRLLMTIPSIGEITALTWALETGEPDRFRSISKAVSYCGLCSAQRESAGIGYRGPLSKAAQQTSAKRVGGNRQAGAAVQSAVGGAVCAGTGTRRSQSSDFGGRSQTRSLFAVGGPQWKGFSNSRIARRRGNQAYRDHRQRLLI